jgi:nitroimidazol reductase NimA-like FMN-containing flavoprotein (pyridoxamine 5'-phosphate oxidase superfamily)
MFREMRLQKQLLPIEEAVVILQTATSGVLGVSGDDGYPYTVPVSHVYDNGKLFFHCAVKGWMPSKGMPKCPFV